MGKENPPAAAGGIAGHQDLLTALRLIPGGQEAFGALPLDEQIAYAEWLDRSTSAEHRARRIRLLIALVTRAGMNDTGERRSAGRGGGRG